MVSFIDLLRAVINAHHQVVNAEVSLVQDLSPDYQHRALERAERANAEFNAAITAVLDRIKELEGKAVNA